MTLANQPLKLENILAEEKRLIFWAEIGALLHDIGKLSNIFLEYRQVWQKGETISDPAAQSHFGQGGTTWHWGNDPHEHEFLDFDHNYKFAYCHCS